MKNHKGKFKFYESFNIAVFYIRAFATCTFLGYFIINYIILFYFLS